MEPLVFFKNDSCFHKQRKLRKDICESYLPASFYLQVGSSICFVNKETEGQKAQGPPAS